MINFKLKIKNSINVTEKCKNYSYAFRYLYKNFELSEDKNFIKEFRKRFDLDSWEYNSLKEDVLTKLELFDVDIKKKTLQLKELEKQLLENNFKNKKHKFKTIQRIAYLKKNIGKPIVFGSKSVLRKISYLSNTDNIEELNKWKKQFKDNRLLSIYILGNSYDNSNRKFNFDLTNHKITYKPRKGIKIDIEFYSRGKQFDTLCRLQEFIGKIPITVRLNNDYICLTFDEEKLNGYSFNESEYYKELKTVPKEDKLLRKQIYIKYIKEQEEKKLKNKVRNRYISFDLNPENIGFVIFDKLPDNSMNLIHKENISFKNLNTKLKLSSLDPKQKYQNNKRKYELYQAWKHIFKLAEHYKVAHCVIEQLEFKNNKVNTENKEFNRKTKNIWNLGITKNCIDKYCSRLGIKKIEVLPFYSSFIGNIKYKYFDSINAAIEIGRRGIFKYIKGNHLYPELTRTDIHTMYSLMSLDVEYKNIDKLESWKQFYDYFKTSKLKYRWNFDNVGINNYQVFSLNNKKSKVKLFNFR